MRKGTRAVVCPARNRTRMATDATLEVHCHLRATVAVALMLLRPSFGLRVGQLARPVLIALAVNLDVQLRQRIHRAVSLSRLHHQIAPDRPREAALVEIAEVIVDLALVEAV